MTKNTLKHIKSLGLKAFYDNDDMFKTNIKMISSLAYVPEQHVIRDFMRLAAHCGNPEQPVLDWFENTYIGQPMCGRRNAPMFPISLWNINHNLPRTTNHVEDWHSKLNRLASSHPSIWKYIDVLRKDFANNHYNMTQAL